MNDWVTLVAILAGAGGWAGSVYALLKARPEIGMITVSAAHDVVLIQKGMIDDLRSENVALRDQVEALRVRVRNLESAVKAINGGGPPMIH